MLYLRKPTSSDEAEIRNCYARSKSLHQPWTYEPSDISAYLAQPERYFLCLESTDAIVGTFNLSNIVRGYFHSAYLGYEVFEPYQGKGWRDHERWAIINPDWDGNEG